MGLGLQPAIARATYRLNCLAVRALSQRAHLVVLTYHRVGSRRELWPEPFELAECTLEQFEAQMEWVRRYCTPLDLDGVIKIVHGGHPLPNRPVLVTFDDGYREDLLRVQPVLERLGIRSTVFLPTDYVGTHGRFWWDRIGVIVESTRRSHVGQLGGRRLDLPLVTQQDRDQAASRLMELAKPEPAPRRAELIAELERELDVDSTAESRRRLVLSWDEVRELRDTFDFDAHTRTHPVLSSLSAREAREELAGARAAIERELQQPCRTFAIPYGGAGDYTDETLRLAAEIGYSVVFSLEETLRGPVRHGELALVDRVSLNARGGLAGMALKVTWPRVFIPDWTGRALRQLERARA